MARSSGAPDLTTYYYRSVTLLVHAQLPDADTTPLAAVLASLVPL